MIQWEVSRDGDLFKNILIPFSIFLSLNSLPNVPSATVCDNLNIESHSHRNINIFTKVKIKISIWQPTICKFIHFITFSLFVILLRFRLDEKE